MNPFKLKISTIDGDMFEGAALKLDVRAKGGELAIMAGHTPLMTAVMPCRCRILLPDGTERTGEIKNALLSVTPDRTMLLASGFRFTHK